MITPWPFFNISCAAACAQKNMPFKLTFINLIPGSLVQLILVALIHQKADKVDTCAIDDQSTEPKVSTTLAIILSFKRTLALHKYVHPPLHL